MDKQLLQQIQKGDKAAFTLLVNRYQKPLFAYLGRMGIRQVLAEEIAQETFIRIWKSRERFDTHKSSFSTWLFTIARRLTLNELDRYAYRYETTTDDSAVLVESLLDTPDKNLEQVEQKENLRRALLILESHERSLLSLAYIRELEFSVIAEIEGIPVGTVKSRLYRIRKCLQQYLGEINVT